MFSFLGTSEFRNIDNRRQERGLPGELKRLKRRKQSKIRMTGFRNRLMGAFDASGPCRAIAGIFTLAAGHVQQW